MAQNVTINGVQYNDVPAVEVPKTGGGRALFMDQDSYRTAAEQDIIDGSKVSVYDYNPDVKTEAMTQAVGKDENGKLWTAPGGGGGGGGTAASISYNPTASGLEAENVQDALDELADGSDAAAVKYVGQSLSDAQKAQARENINAAAPDGYYGESGGVYQYSTNFLGKNTPQNASNLVFRPTASQFSGSGWSSDSISGQTATIEKIKGKTLVWNQLVDTNTTSVTVPNGHKYRFYDKDGTDSILTSNGTAFEVAGGDDMVTDLTQMYGSTVANSMTLAEFKAQFPLDYYQYNAGELISLNATGLKTNGFNLFDSHDTVEKEVGGYIKIIPSADRQRVIATLKRIQQIGLPVYYTVTASSGGSISTTGLLRFTEERGGTVVAEKYFYKNTITDISDWDFDSFTHAYVYGLSSGSVTFSNACINFSWSGVRNGEYEPYWDSTLSLPIASYFEDGMKSAGTVYDELSKDKYIKRIGVVDLGTLTWEKPYRNKNIFKAVVSNAVDSSEKNFECAKYFKSNANDIHEGIKDKAITMQSVWWSMDWAKSVLVRDTSYSTSSAFKTAMNGVMLYYELAEPVETPINPPMNLTCRCGDFGTEMLLPQNDEEPITAPMDADIVYNFDYEANIRNNDRLNITKESMDNFIAAFNASGLGMISQTWDGANRRYTYTVVPPAAE